MADIAALTQLIEPEAKALGLDVSRAGGLLEAARAKLLAAREKRV